MVLDNLVQYKVRKIRGNYYLYKEWYDPEAKKKRSLYIGPCERIERVYLLLRDLSDEDIKKVVELVRRPGFEPGISGSAGRRPRPG